MERAIIVDDNILKAIAIQRALEETGIRQIEIVGDLETLWGKIEEAQAGGEVIDLIVTDMHYPLAPRSEADVHAGFKLIEKMKEENVDIPVIICSSLNYKDPEVLGTVWYSELVDLKSEFKKILGR